MEEILDMIVFRYGKQTEYDALTTKDANALYIIDDTGKIYKGDKLIAEKNSTGSGEAVDLSGYVYDPTYSNSILTLKVQGGSDVTIDFSAMLKDRFLTGAQYYESYAEGEYAENPQSNVIVFTIEGQEAPVLVPVGALIDTYTAKANGKAIQIAVQNKEISAELVITDSEEQDGSKLVIINPDGTLVKKTAADAVGSAIADAITTAFAEGGALKAALDAKMDKMAAGTADEVVTATADGNVQRSGVKIGGATISATPDATTLATEAAIAKVLSWKPIVETAK